MIESKIKNQEIINQVNEKTEDDMEMRKFIMFILEHTDGNYTKQYETAIEDALKRGE